MEIQNRRKKTNFVKKIYRRKDKSRFFKIGIFAALFLVISFASILYGAYLNKTAQTSNLRMLVSRMADLDFSFINNKIESEIAHIEEFSIDVKFKNWEKIRYYRELALENNKISQDIQNSVPAKLVHKNKTYRVDLTITGLTVLHLLHPYKWSLGVKVKDGETINGMKKFALLFPQSRGYLTDWIATELLKTQNIVGLRNGFANVEINGHENGVYYVEERFDKRLLENNHFKEGIIFKHRYNELKIYGLKNIMENEQQASQLINLKKLIHSFETGRIEANNLFDLEKFASMLVVTDIIGLKHALFRSNMRLYYNPITGLIEPIGREWGYLRKETRTPTSLFIERPNLMVKYHTTLQNDDFLSKIFDSFEFEEQYIKKALILTDPIFLDSVVALNQSKMDQLLKEIHKFNPFYIFPLDILHENQKYIHDKLNTKLPDISAYNDHIDKDIISISFENLVDLPVEIHYLNYNSKKQIFPNERTILNSKYKEKEKYQKKAFRLPGNINFDDFSTDSLEIYYSVLGVNTMKKIMVFPKKMKSEDYLNLNLTKRASNISDFEFLTIDEQNKTIHFSKMFCSINKDMFIPKGYTITAIPGCEIDLTKASKIISYSPLRFFGKKNQPIKIFSSDSSGLGITILNCEDHSQLSFVEFDNLSNSKDEGWNLTAAITFYESPVNIDNSLFKNNLLGDDYLNIVRTDFNIVNSIFKNTKADALDSDFCNGNIENVKFLQIGNDAIDVSGTKLTLNNVEISNPNDKGISGGEASHLIGYNIRIRGGEIAIASKDNTIIDISDLSIESSKLAYCAFQKKPEYGPGKIYVKNGKLTNVNTEYLIEYGSSLWINGKEIEEKSNKVKELLYGAEFGKSSN